MTKQLKIYKEISGIPTPYSPDAIYIVRVGTGFSLFVSDTTGEAVFELNSKESFETVSKNLRSVDYTLNYTAGVLTSITYSNGVVKTLNYAGGTLSSIVLSGATPAEITLTKNLNYTGDVLSSITYS